MSKRAERAVRDAPGALAPKAPEGILEDLISSWNGESVSIHHDRESGATIFVCVHSTALGPAAGGTRMKHYPHLADALKDGMRLSEAMTLKFASVDFPFGGGKAVIAVGTPDIPRGEERRRLLHAYGSFVDSLGGLYSCAPDMNTSAADMDVIGQVTQHVFCRTEKAGGSGDTAPDTAVGVLAGIRATCRFVFGTDDLSKRSVLVQGAGGVGGRLIELLTEADATVIATDVDGARLEKLASSGLQTVAPDDALTTACDVLAPCAIGGVLNARSIPKLRCRAVAGGANNQLETAEDGEHLRELGIAHAPDFVINAGGILHGGGLEALHWSRATLDERLAGIGDRVLEILQAAQRDGVSSDAAARKLALAKISATSLA